MILEGRRDAAKELNDAVRVLGEVGPDAMEKIARDFKTARSLQGDYDFTAERYPDHFFP